MDSISGCRLAFILDEWAFQAYENISESNSNALQKKETKYC